MTSLRIQVRRLRNILPLALLLLAACDRSSSGSPASGGPPSRETSAQPESGLPVATDTMELQAVAMLSAMRTHLDSTRSGAAMTEASLSQHQLRVRDFMRSAETDMKRLGMHSDPAYEALADSVLRGLEGLAKAGGLDLERLTAAHVDRVQRLASVYERMVRGR